MVGKGCLFDGLLEVETLIVIVLLRAVAFGHGDGRGRNFVVMDG